MTLGKNTDILIVGLGLIGGSYADGLTKGGYKVRAITADKGDIDYAVGRGMITGGSDEVTADTVGTADIIIFALYPHIFVEWIEKYGHLIKPGAVITDVTGVKSAIVDKVQSILPDGVEFIAAHPMAGREVSGVKNASADIFRAANYIVVPTERNTDGAIEICKQLGHILGFKDISVLSPEEHDEMVAFLSQLTHCIAVTLMCCNQSEGLERYTGDSFRDLTRIARINDEMWSELFLLNRDKLLYEMEQFSQAFSQLRCYMIKGDREGIRQMMRTSAERRRLFDKID
ncbi:MAG: prephenate dehydrogenase [Firmicutes bacterium]|nr:prephenate dehydrogenase [Bacillota bacterium]